MNISTITLGIIIGALIGLKINLQMVVASGELYGPELPPRTNIVDQSCVGNVYDEKLKLLVNFGLARSSDEAYDRFPDDLPKVLSFKVELPITSVEPEVPPIPITLYVFIACYSQGSKKLTMYTKHQCQYCIQYIREELIEKHCLHQVSVFFLLQDCYLGYTFDTAWGSSAWVPPRA